jgi:putative ABC transport system permease protein
MGMARVPVGRRNLFSDRRRAFLGIAGVAASLFMVLALDGIFGGAMRQVTAYIDSSGADVFVSQRGVRTMHMSSSSVPLAAVTRIRRVAGVRWADPILYDSGALLAGDRLELSYLIGFVPGGRGGPASIVAGTEPGPGEIVLDRDAATTLGVALGAQVGILDRSWRVSGLTEGMTNIVNSVSYVRFEDFAGARGLEGLASYVLVGTVLPASQIVPRIEGATGLTAQSRAGFASQERRGVKDMSTDLMQIMTFAALLIGLAVIGLTLYAATLSRLPEIGVMKALGARPGSLGRIVLSQAAWTVGGALLIAVLLAVGLGWLLSKGTATLPLVVEWPSVVRAATGAAVLGALGALAPLVRVWRVDPASVFRR